jgi:hypothetical protein
MKRASVLQGVGICKNGRCENFYYETLAKITEGAIAQAIRQQGMLIFRTHWMIIASFNHPTLSPT